MSDTKLLTQLYRELVVSPVGKELLKWLDAQQSDLLNQAVTNKDPQTRLGYLDEAKGVQSVAQYVRGFAD